MVKTLSRTDLGVLSKDEKTRKGGLNEDPTAPEKTLGELLLAPTEIYVRPLLDLMAQTPVHGIAHITGGGLLENIPRMLPHHMKAVIEQSSWEWPAVFKWLQTQGNIDLSEMYRTFNCGVGMVICVPAQTAPLVLSILNHKWAGSPHLDAAGAQRLSVRDDTNQGTRHAWVIGSVEASTEKAPHTEIT